MDFEVDFLAVGDGSKSGDAIALRFGNLSGPREQQRIVVIDGGTKDSGEKLVQLIREYYDPDGVVDLVISTHPDGDHASGLTVVLEKLDVQRLWMHQPWNHSEEIHHLFEDGRITEDSLDRRLRESLEHAHDLEIQANEKDIQIEEPFSGETNYGEHLRVLGPSREFYEELLPHFRDTPELTTEASTFMARFSQAAAAVVEAVRTVFESWTIETLADPDEDATDQAENNSSAIILLEVDGQCVLFTADAGVSALDRAADYAASIGIDLKTVQKIQIPHHGSKHNVGPTILNRIIGSKLSSSSSPGVDAKSAIVSVAVEGAPNHPAKKVLNAFKRRGAKCFKTAGKGLRWSSPGAPDRPGWKTSSSEPLHDRVEE
ncbi:MAG TPA: MBL fold metallo-hydrolase [Phycisphaerae bacterium]|nr:MBL fold metallo-hydrolase [Phycisphaerae bacterium]